eukprot:GHVN01073831.1.p1 GENE.GHVN01073831.1~~GHVN01073831.1.p1  ORF type:complete len:729 (+),score=162.60 GHVN01073831.1:55-2241(+)
MNSTLVLIYCFVGLTFSIFVSVQSRRERPRVERVERADRQNTQGSLETTSTCPLGYCLIEGQCLKATLVDPELRCPQGHVEDGDECIWHMKVNDASCSRGNRDEDCRQVAAECVCEVMSSKLAQCPDGMEFDGEKCGVFLDAPSSCPEGLAFVDEKCARLLTRRATCEEGFTLGAEGRFCERVDVVRASLMCPEGSQRVGMTCRAPVKAKPVCADGDTDMGDMCVRSHELEVVCPEFMKLENGMCRRTHIKELSPMCPNDGDIEQNCLKILPGPIIRSCSEGDLVNGVCVKSEEVSAFADCPEGFVFDSVSDECVRQVPYDCSETEWKVECDEPPVCDEMIDTQCVPVCKGRNDRNCLPSCQVDESDSGRQKEGDDVKEEVLGTGACVEVVPVEGGRMLRESRDGKRGDGEKQRRRFRVKFERNDNQATQANAPVCHKVPIARNKTCFQVVKAEASPFCRVGTYVGKGMCSQKVQREAAEKCAGEVIDGECMMRETMPMVFGCPESYTEVNGQCELTERKRPSLLCKEGEEENGRCVSLSSKRCENEGCVVTAVSNAIANCPAGYVKRQRKQRSGAVGSGRVGGGEGGHSLISDIIVGDGFVCEKVEFAKPTIGCPEGSEELNEIECIEFVSPVQSEAMSSVKAQLTCPVGTLTSEFGCSTEVRFPVGQQCEAGSVDSGACEVRSPKVKRCPKGAREQLGHCFVIAETEAYDVETFVEKQGRERRDEM